jgi:hypothetical protein
MAPLPRLFVAAMMRRSGTKRKSARGRSATDETGRATDETGAVGGVATADPATNGVFRNDRKGLRWFRRDWRRGAAAGEWNV